jgi:hypothetical protein
MPKYFIGGYEVSADTKIADDRQQELNRQREYRDAELQRQTELLKQIAANTKA